MLLPLAGGFLRAESIPEPPTFEPVHTWIDAPRPNTVLAPPNPCRIIGHGSSAAGITSFELSVDDTAPTAIPSPDTAASLVTLTFDCDVSDPGLHIVRLRAVDANGTWSSAAQSSFVVPGMDGPIVEEVERLDPTTSVPESTTTVSESTTVAPPPPPPANTTRPPATTVAPPPATTAAPPPTTTVAPPPPADTRPPSVSVAHSPTGSSLPESSFTTFTATAGDNVGVTRIEIIIRVGVGRGSVVATCDGVDVCEYTNRYPPGSIYYSARAYDTAGNQTITPETGINFFVVVK